MWRIGLIALVAVPLHAAEPHWAFQPVRQPPMPAVRNASWVRTPVDRFILAKLEANGLTPSPEANRRTILRRVSIDLTGLPPTPEEIDAFERDRSPDAYERVVERLLNSPRYGVRWARHWLDVARYADSKGYVFQEERRYPFSFTYRDYVVQAFNSDLPYDRFILEQLAADRLDRGGDPQPLAAMGFLTLGRRFLNNSHDIIDDRIDVVTRGLLGLTVSCARCHDHKYDPIPTRDYYSLYGVFASSIEPKDLPLLGDPGAGPKLEAFQRELQRLKDKKAKFEKENAKQLKERNRNVREQLRAIQKEIDRHLLLHPGSPPRAMVLHDLPQPVEPHVLIRGSPGNRGPRVPRQFLEVLAGKARKPFQSGSGRLELANAIASKDNPLTARVLVNRVWIGHFGQGLVRTPSDFGLRSESPTHPQLLDWLAAQFMANGWSIKQLHRWIVLSATYRQIADCRLPIADLQNKHLSSQSAIRNPQSAISVDPDNRLLARRSRRRLDYEAMRDSLLYVAGRLDESFGGAAVDLYKEPFSRRRTIYGFIDRQNLPGTMRTFDFASPDTHCPQRHETTVPQQALFLMNSPFLQEQAEAVAHRAAGDSDEVRLTALYRLLFCRKPDVEERSLGLAFVRGAGADAWTRYAQVLLMSNEFAFVD